LALVDAKRRAKVIAASRLVPYRAGRPVVKEGDPPGAVFCLLEGAVRVFHRAPDKSELLVKLFRAPALFGEMEVLVGIPMLEFVSTVERSEILQVPATVFRELLDLEPRFLKALVIDLSARLCIATHNERALGFLDVETRLANLLNDYADLAGEHEDGALRIAVALTQDGMARDLAVSRRSLIRALEKLRREKLIAKRDGRYVILDRARLRARGSGMLGLTYRLPDQRQPT
jgi:CRP-like cAMP-binding protein